MTEGTAQLGAAHLEPSVIQNRGKGRAEATEKNFFSPPETDRQLLNKSPEGSVFGLSHAAAQARPDLDSQPWLPPQMCLGGEQQRYCEGSLAQLAKDEIEYKKQRFLAC